MNEIDFLKQAAGSNAAVPSVDVRASVIRTLQSTPREEPSSSWAITSTSVIVALLLGVWAWRTVSDVQDSIGSLVAPVEVHLQ